MKNLILACLLLTTPSFAETFMGEAKLKKITKDDINVVGMADLKDVTSKSLSVTGPLKFEDLTVSGTTNVTGTVKGKKAEFSDINVIGHVKLEDVKYKSLKATGETELEHVTTAGTTEVVGDLEIEKSEIKDLVATSEKVKLKAVKANNITIKKNDGSTKIQELKIEDESEITGNIVFEAGKGLVKIESGVKFNGTVKGAEVQK